MQRGKFITIEGTEGAGKSTALAFIRDYLQQKNIAAVVTREPGGTELAEEIRKVLLYPASGETMQAKTELLLMFAARSQHVSQLIQPSLMSGKWVLSDRFVDASYAYQGGGRGVENETIAILDSMTVQGLYPDLTLLLDIPADVGLMRTVKRGGEKDRIEHERVEFFMRVRQIYLDRAAQDAKRIKVIDANQDLPAVQAQIQTVLDAFMLSAAKAAI